MFLLPPLGAIIGGAVGVLLFVIITIIIIIITLAITARSIRLRYSKGKSMSNSKLIYSYMSSIQDTSYLLIFR